MHDLDAVLLVDLWNMRSNHVRVATHYILQLELATYYIDMPHAHVLSVASCTMHLYRRQSR